MSRIPNKKLKLNKILNIYKNNCEYNKSCLRWNSLLHASFPITFYQVIVDLQYESFYCRNNLIIPFYYKIKNSVF
jgi:hypothetical protein